MVTFTRSRLSSGLPLPRPVRHCGLRDCNLIRSEESTKQLNPELPACKRVSPAQRAREPSEVRPAVARLAGGAGGAGGVVEPEARSRVPPRPGCWAPRRLDGRTLSPRSRRSGAVENPLTLKGTGLDTPDQAVLRAGATCLLPRPEEPAPGPGAGRRSSHVPGGGGLRRRWRCSPEGRRCP